ncbi:MAG: ISAs1 family transposase [Bacteroidota bacterium]
MAKSLVDYFSQIPDPRKASGLRHPLVPFLTMSTMAIMSGYTGFREIGTFMEANGEAFARMFGFKHGVPKFVQIRTIFSVLDFEAVAHAFRGWASQFNPGQAGQFVSADGKGLASTVVHQHGAKQDYVMMVSLFVQRSGVALRAGRRNNGKGGELPALQSLLEQLGFKGMVITLDALHCTKKTSG